MNQQASSADPGAQTARALKVELDKAQIPTREKLLEPSVVYIPIGRLDPVYRLLGRCNMAVPTMDGTGIRFWVRNVSCLSDIRPVLGKMEEMGYNISAQDLKGTVLYQSERRDVTTA